MLLLILYIILTDSAHILHSDFDTELETVISTQYIVTEFICFVNVLKYDAYCFTKIKHDATTYVWTYG